MAPATILAVLGYVSLRQWAASADLLFREQARDVAAMAVEKIEMQLRHADDAFLNQVQDRLSSHSTPDGSLDALVAQSPLIRELYVVDRRGRLVYPPAGRVGDAGAVRRRLQTLSPESWERGGRQAIMSDDHAFLTAVLPARGAPVLVVFSRDFVALRRQIFATTLGALESPTICAVLDDAERPVYSPQIGRAHV